MQIDISQKLEQFNLKGAKIAVGVSGGTDSMALLLLLRQYYNGEIIALTVDHKLRKESSDEALQVGEWVKKIGIKHEILVWEGQKPTSNIEAIARKKRYQLLCDYCKENDIKSLFIAHNLNDQAETFLLRLRRSSGLFGLSGMEDVTKFQNISVLRPLLGVSRKDIEEFLADSGQEYVHDSFNDDDRYDRVKVRKFLPSLQEIGITPDVIVNSMKLLQADKLIMKKKIEEVFNANIKLNPIGFFELKLDIFNEDFSIFLYAISEFFSKLGLEIPRAEKIETFYLNGRKETQPLGGLIFCHNKGKILIAPEYERVKNKTVKLEIGQITTFLGFTIKAKFDTMIKTMGFKTSKEIKKMGIPLLIRQSLPMLVIGENEIVPFMEKDSKDFEIEYNPFDNYISIFEDDISE